MTVFAFCLGRQQVGGFELAGQLAVLGLSDLRDIWSQGSLCRIWFHILGLLVQDLGDCVRLLSGQAARSMA